MAFVEYRIGRRKDMDIVIDDPAVSRLHAELVETDDKRYFLTDCASTGGTFVKRDGEWEKVRQQFVTATEPVRFGNITETVTSLLKKSAADGNDAERPAPKQTAGGSEAKRPAPGPIAGRSEAKRPDPKPIIRGAPPPKPTPKDALPDGPVKRDPLSGAIIRQDKNPDDQ